MKKIFDQKDIIEIVERYRAEILKRIENLCTKFPVRGSDDFDEGRESMKREVKEILNKLL